jgi:hypothetical protein
MLTGFAERRFRSLSSSRVAIATSLRRWLQNATGFPEAAEAAIPEEPDDAEGGTGGIDQDIGPARVAIGDEGLVELVRGGIKRGNEPSGKRSFSGPCSCGGGGPGKCARKEPGQNGVLRHVGGFADDVHDLVEAFLGNVRDEESDEGRDEARACGAGLRVSRSGKDDGHPNEDGQPVAKKLLSARHGAMKASGGCGKQWNSGCATE